MPQGVYYRRSTNTPWEFLGKTRSVGHAENKMRRKALATGVGVFVYIEGRNFCLTAWTLRAMGPIRLLARRIAKSFLPHYKPIRRSGRRMWQRHPLGQLSLALSRQEKRDKP
jgi:hypothetical protein